MRVKLEQASKAAMWAPTRRMSGEGRADREQPGAGAHHLHNQHVPIWSTGVVSTACEEGSLRQWGRPGMVEESRTSNVIFQDDGPSGRRKGSDVPMKPGNAGGGKDPCFWRACEEGKEW
jgi:hypothetical protein